jgi:hypothetical protein
MHAEGGMREHRPTVDNLASRLGVSPKQVSDALMRLRKEKKVRWASRFAPRAEQVITLRRNPGSFLSPPEVEHAAAVVRQEGFSGVTFVREATGSRGPVLVFRAREGREEVVVNVGRTSGDRLVVLWKPLRLTVKAKPNSNYRRLWAYWALSEQSGGDVGDALPNPRGVEVYDPREEQLRAQRQAIYETQVLRHLGKSGPFRGRGGKRADVGLSEDQIRKLTSRCMFAMGTGVQHRDARVYPGTQQFTSKAAGESARRYSDVDKLVRNRQDYEETLGLARKSGFYRVTKELTDDGLQPFVWPMPPGAKAPIRAASEQEAHALADELNATADPRRTKKWWSPPKAKYRSAALQYWLPPGEVFSPTYNIAQPTRRRTRRRRA